MNLQNTSLIMIYRCTVLLKWTFPLHLSAVILVIILLTLSLTFNSAYILHMKLKK